MWVLRNLFRRRPKKVSGITIFFLQTAIERFSSEQLSGAMQCAWRQPYDDTNFYGMSIFEGDGGLLKYNDWFFTMQHFDRRVDAVHFKSREIPSWAAHSAYTKFGYECPGGIPPGKVRDTMNFLLGAFCAQLLGDNTRALLFVEDGILLRYTPELKKRLRSKPIWNLAELAAVQSVSDDLSS